MRSNAYMSARAGLLTLAASLLGACAAPAPSAAVPPGELALEWSPEPELTELAASVELEVRSVSGATALREQIALGARSAPETRLTLPAGVYAIGLSSASAEVEAELEEAPEARLELPPPRVVLVSPGATTRARVVLSAAPADSVASLPLNL